MPTLENLGKWIQIQIYLSTVTTSNRCPSSCHHLSEWLIHLTPFTCPSFRARALSTIPIHASFHSTAKLWMLRTTSRLVVWLQWRWGDKMFVVLETYHRLLCYGNSGNAHLHSHYWIERYSMCVCVHACVHARVYVMFRPFCWRMELMTTALVL